MSRPRGLGQEPAAGWRRPGGVLLTLACIGVAVWGGCTVTPKNYKMLSFFFDGVPDPAALGPGGARGANGVVGDVRVWVHKPFAEEKCDACHKTRYRPSKNDGSICLACHEKIPSEHERMHGPVTVGACIWCHTPHESRYPHLLRDTDRKVCSQCHSANILDTTKVAAHADESRGCLECHMGHGGGTGRFMLREAAAAGESPGSAPPPAAPEK